MQAVLLGKHSGQQDSQNERSPGRGVCNGEGGLFLLDGFLGWLSRALSRSPADLRAGREKEGAGQCPGAGNRPCRRTGTG